jgi:hypothetical protein
MELMRRNRMTGQAVCGGTNQPSIYVGVVVDNAARRFVTEYL